ncbi:MAG: hypothetical protein JSV91_10675 [Phycisphaerales bacterium]|nr:MAG: hypothetical protein JSV91_10675 [Phycisphaerales bacterium]
MPEANARPRRVSRPWRIAFVTYALALTIGTHWPALELPPTVPISDKGLHLLAFAALAFLLWRTQWIESRWLVAIIAGLWSVLDEYSQGIPGLNRHVTWEDGLSNLLGVVVVLVWLWALRPIGGGPNRMRLACLRFAFEEFSSRRLTWLIGFMAGAACTVPVALVWKRFDADEKSIPVFIAVAAWMSLVTLLWVANWHSAFRNWIARKPCPVCTTSCAGISPDDSGQAQCPSCGELVHVSQWSQPATPSLRIMMSFSLWPAMIFIVVLVAGFGLIAASSIVYALLLERQVGGAHVLRVAHTIGTLPGSVTQVVDLTAYLVLFAVAVRVYRGALARYYDQALKCRKCGHDLRGTPTDDRGRGRCGECGVPFVRILCRDE